MDGVSAKAFDKRELAMLRVASKLVRAVNERDVLRGQRRRHKFHHIRCHELARAVGKILGLKVVDGHIIDRFGLGEHSWLVTHRGHILDVYSPLRLPMVQLVFCERFPVVHLYKEGGLKLNEKVDSKMVSDLVRAMKRAQKGPLNLPPIPRVTRKRCFAKQKCSTTRKSSRRRGK